MGATRREGVAGRVWASEFCAVAARGRKRHARTNSRDVEAIGNYGPDRFMGTLLDKAGSLVVDSQGEWQIDSAHEVSRVFASEQIAEGSIRGDALGGDHAGKRRVDFASRIVRVQGEGSGIGISIRAQQDLFDELCAVLGRADGIRRHRGIVHIALPGDVVEEIGV